MAFRVAPLSFRKETCNTFENETEQSNNKLNYKPQEPSDDFEDGLHQKFDKIHMSSIKYNRLGTKKAWNFALSLVSRIEAFALPGIVETSNAEAHADMLNPYLQNTDTRIVAYP